MIAARSVTAKYSAWRVLTTGVIDEIAVDGLHLNVIEEPDGWNVLGLGVERPEQERTAGPTISIGRLLLTDENGIEAAVALAARPA